MFKNFRLLNFPLFYTLAQQILPCFYITCSTILVKTFCATPIKLIKFEMHAYAKIKI